MSNVALFTSTFNHFIGPLWLDSQPAIDPVSAGVDSATPTDRDYGLSRLLPAAEDEVRLRLPLYPGLPTFRSFVSICLP